LASAAISEGFDLAGGIPTGEMNLIYRRINAFDVKYRKDTMRMRRIIFNSV
jgi:hypothetical protein